MALLLASTADLWALLRAISLAVASLSTATALASELTLDRRIRAVGLVVTRLIAIVAKTRVGALLPRLGTVARVVAFASAALLRISRRAKQVWGLVCDLLAAGVVASTGVLGDVLADIASVLVVDGRGAARTPGVVGGRSVGREAILGGGRCKDCQPAH